MRSKPVVRRGEAPELAVMKAHRGIEADNTDLSAATVRHRFKYSADGADASIRRVIRQPR